MLYILDTEPIATAIKSYILHIASYHPITNLKSNEKVDHSMCTYIVSHLALPGSQLNADWFLVLYIYRVKCI